MKYIISAILMIASTALAQEQGYLTVSKVTSGSDLDLSAAAASRTITATLTHDNTATGRPVYAKWMVIADYTYSAASTVTAQFTCSLDGTTYGRRTSTSTSAGASTIYKETGTYTTDAASGTLTLEYDIRGCKRAQLLLGGAGAGASDLIDWSWVAVAGG